MISCSATRARTGRSRRPRPRPGSGWAWPWWRGCSTGWSASVGWSAASCGPQARAPTTATPRCCAGCGRASLARLRAEVEPVEPRALGRFLPVWQGVQTAPVGERRGRMRRAPGAEDVLGVVEQLAGAPLPASALESLILPARLPGYTPALLDELTAAGEVSWTGCGPLAGSDGWLALAPADVADLLLPEPEPDTVATPLHTPCSTRSTAAGALFFRQLADAAGRALIEAARRHPATTPWSRRSGISSGPGCSRTTRSPRCGRGSAVPAARGESGAPRPAYRVRAAAMPGCARAGLRCPAERTAVGRWTVGPRARPRARSHPPRTRQRRGVPRTARRAHPRRAVHRTRHAAASRASTGCCARWRTPDGRGAATSWRGSARPSSRCPARSTASARSPAPTAPRPVQAVLRIAADGRLGRRRPVAVRWRGRRAAQRRGGLSRVVLAAADPAQPYGAALPWPATLGDTKHRPGRKAGALVVLVEGAPALYVERGGRSLLSFTTERDELVAAAQALAGAVHEGWLGTLAVERADGVGSLGSELAEVLTEAGFRVTPKGLRLRA